MTSLLNHNTSQPKTPLLPFAPADLDRCGIRMTRADLARFLGVSRTAVTEWVKSGKVCVGSDGRLDPRQAVGQLLRSTDPARLRSKVLAPLGHEIDGLRKRIADLEARLAAAGEEAQFQADVNRELIDQWSDLHRHLRDDWEALVALPAHRAQAALIEWSVGVEDSTINSATMSILSLVDLSPMPEYRPAADEEEGGGDSTTFPVFDVDGAE
jgi:hypothetical protein